MSPNNPTLSLFSYRCYSTFLTVAFSTAAVLTDTQLDLRVITILPLRRPPYVHLDYRFLSLVLTRRAPVFPDNPFLNLTPTTYLTKTPTSLRSHNEETRITRTRIYPP